ncbi:hypothetical protein LguiA_026568 [Lonicera macranthoides]
MELPDNIGALKNLELLDLEGTELACLPEEIGDLLQLEYLKVSLYRCADNYIRRKGIEAIIPTRALSKLSRLKELSIHVDSDCEWWDVKLRTIIKELSELRNLKLLKLYFPTDELLQQFMQLPRNVYTNLSSFRLIVDRHESDIVICLPDDLQSEYEKSDKCLKYVNGEGNTDVVGKALEHAKALFLDRHWTFEKLSVFTIQEMTLLMYCLIVECNIMETIIDGSDFYKEGDNATANDRRPALELLRYLSVHHMKNLQCIWKGPIVTGCLSSLEILALHTCPELITIFNLALLRNLVNLNELIVKDCPKIQSLVSVGPGLLEADHAFLPSLQTILLVHLPELLSISSGLIIPQKLQKIVVYNCPKLDNLSPEDKYIKYMHKVEDESQCSKALDLSSNETDYMHHVFVQLMDRLKQSGNSLNQPSLENQIAARTEDLIINKDLLKEDKGLIINKDMLKEDKTKQGVPPYQYGIYKPTNNVSIVLVCGVSGIGKTTIAKLIYNSNYDKFEGSCFLSNIGEYSRKPDGLLRLQEQLLSSILPKKKKEGKMNIYDVNDGMLLIKYAIRRERVLIVLDDVDELSQLHALIGNKDWYCPGSKIIVTTRQMQLLKHYKVHNQYVVRPLDEEESLRLFSLHAFGNDHPVPSYEDFTRRLVIHCGGLPLALVVLGSSLFSSDLSIYRSVIKKLELIPRHEVINWLKVSLDSIHDDKYLFLHFACFFIGKDANHVTTILNEQGYDASAGIQTLVHRRLLTIDRDRKLQMHQLLQDMGRDIVRQESPERRRRLKCHEVAVNVFTERTAKGPNCTLNPSDIETKKMFSLLSECYFLEKAMALGSLHFNSSFCWVV